MNKYITYTFLFLLFSSCATIFVPRTQRNVEISCTDAEGAIYVDGFEAGKTSFQKDLKRGRLPYKVEVKKEGYKTRKGFLMTSRLNTVPLIFDGVLTPVFGAGLVGMIIDNKTGKAYSYEKKYELESPVMIRSKSEDQRYILVNNCFVENSESAPIGAIYAWPGTYKNGLVKSSLYQNSTETYNSAKLTEDLNEALGRYGYSDTTDRLMPNDINSVYVDTKIMSYFYSSIEAVSASAKSQTVGLINLYMQWDFKNIYGDTLTSISFAVDSDPFLIGMDINSTFKHVVKDALDYATLKVLGDPEIIELLRIPESEGNEFLEEINIESRSSESIDLNAAVKSCVTIKAKGGHGSGFIISDDGYLITNYHVVNGVSSVDVVLNNKTVVTGTVERVDQIIDLALIKIDTAGVEVDGLPISLDKSIPLGNTIFAIGTPENVALGQTISKGIISGVRESNGFEYIQTDVSINRGNSGGALINEKGNVIGIVSSKFVGFATEGIGFVIPAYYISEKLGVVFK